MEQADAAAEKIGFPVMIRPAFVLGGRAMMVAYEEEELEPFVNAAFAASPDHPVLIDRFLEHAIEIDVDPILGPEMKSTGEVMGIDTDPGMAYIKSQMGAGTPLPLEGSVFLSVADHEKEAVIEPARELQELGYKIYATLGTATILRNNGIKAKALFRIADGRPNALDVITESDIQWIVNVPSGAKPAKDEISIRTEAIRRGIPITTTVRGLQATLTGLKRLKKLKSFAVLSLQEFNRKTRNVNG
jgi:carbamoyl-phosphate synthase large subunit